mmetsp:Transcript_19748/g.24362  ORF Transcript_19748/g.24362 Transcript_19748/m.24362 type:complete len:156 (+) Transcript_19748:433-900(+)
MSSTTASPPTTSPTASPTTSPTDESPTASPTCKSLSKGGKGTSKEEGCTLAPTTTPPAPTACQDTPGRWPITGADTPTKTCKWVANSGIAPGAAYNRPWRCNAFAEPSLLGILSSDDLFIMVLLLPPQLHHVQTLLKDFIFPKPIFLLQPELVSG